VDEHVALAKAGGMDEVVADGKVLGEILVRRIRGHDAQVVLVLGSNGILVNISG